MAHETLDLDAGVWTLLTPTSTSLARVQNAGTATLLVQATADATAPTSEGGALVFQPGQVRSFRLEMMFGGVPMASQLWGKTERAGRVSVSC